MRLGDQLASQYFLSDQYNRSGGLADVLLGRVEPSARLPFSVPRRVEDLPPFDAHATSFPYDRWHGWWHLARTGHEPRFPFGFGLSYTTLVVEDVEVAPSSSPDGPVVVRGVVHNPGARDGAEVVQVYASLPDPDAPDRLVGFVRVPVAAGASAPFELVVPRDRLATRDPVAHAWQAPSGPHTFSVARHAGDPTAARHVVAL